LINVSEELDAGIAGGMQNIIRLTRTRQVDEPVVDHKVRKNYRND